RLGRLDAAFRTGTPAHALEELVAELGGVFLAGALGLTPPDPGNHAAYLALWLDGLRWAPCDLARAAPAAAEAADLLLSFAERPVPRGEKGSVTLLQTPGHFGTNLAVPFADAGHVSVLATVLGDDATAASLERFLGERGVELHAARVAGRPTASSHILIEGG